MMKHFYLILAVSLIMGLMGCSSWSGYEKRNGEIILHYPGGNEINVDVEDYDTFERFSESWQYGKDKDTVYYLGKKVNGADPHSFRKISPAYWADRYAVYYLGQKVEGADPESFQYLGWAWAKDKSSAFYKSQAIKVEDVATFRSLSSGFKYGWAKDSKAYYSYNDSLVRVDCDSNSMEILKYGYAKDSEHVYYFGQVITGADPQSFKVPRKRYDKSDINYTAYDKVFSYEGVERISETKSNN